MSKVAVSLNHVGFTVSDVERSVEFYRDFLGFEPMGEIFQVEGEWISEVLALENAKLRVAFLTLGEFVLELLEYVNPQGDQEVRSTTADTGNAHIAVNVDDIQAVHKRVQASGYRTNSEPVTITSGPWTGNQILYFQDPDGVFIELVQEA